MKYSQNCSIDSSIAALWGKAHILFYWLLKESLAVRLPTCIEMGKSKSCLRNAVSFSSRAVWFGFSSRVVSVSVKEANKGQSRDGPITSCPCILDHCLWPLLVCDVTESNHAMLGEPKASMLDYEAILSSTSRVRLSSIITFDSHISWSLLKTAFGCLFRLGIW